MRRDEGILSLGLSLPSRALLGVSNPPAGFIWLTGADGQFLYGSDGQQLYGRIS